MNTENVVVERVNAKVSFTRGGITSKISCVSVSAAIEFARHIAISLDTTTIFYTPSGSVIKYGPDGRAV